MAIRGFLTEAASQVSEKRVIITWTGSCRTVILEAQAHFLQCLRPPPRSGSCPASPGSFKLTSDRYRGMGEAERLPSISERNTKISEVIEMQAKVRRKCPKWAGNARSESAEKATVAGNCRRSPETTEFDPTRSFLFSATPSPTHATPNRPRYTLPCPIGNQQAGSGLTDRAGIVTWQSWSLDSLHSPLLD